MDNTSFLLPALKEQKLLESQVYKEHYEGKVECEKHIEEKVGEILPGKIDKVLAINTTFIAIKIQMEVLKILLMETKSRRNFMAESNKCLLNHDLQNDDNASDTEEIDEDNIELDVTCLASPSMEQLLDDERENQRKPQINERYQRASGVSRIVVDKLSQYEKD